MNEDLKTNIKLLIALILMGGISFIIGYVVANYNDIDMLDDFFGKKLETNRIDGLWFVKNNISNRLDAMDFAKDYTGETGRWVCVNIKNMDFDRAFQVCRHEVGHEIWANFCEQDQNFDKCVNVTNE